VTGAAQLPQRVCSRDEAAGRQWPILAMSAMISRRPRPGIVFLAWSLPIASRIHHLPNLKSLDFRPMMSHSGRAARREPRAPAIPAGTELAPELSDPRRDRRHGPSCRGSTRGRRRRGRHHASSYGARRCSSATPVLRSRCSSASPLSQKDLLFDAVADARDQGYTWREIAARLACSVRTAHRRFSGYAHQERKPRLS